MDVEASGHATILGATTGPHRPVHRQVKRRTVVRVVSLGRTSIEISEFIFGAGGIGGVGSSPAPLGQGITHDQGLARRDEARALGITVIDTAGAYAGGASEQAVGVWHRTRQPQDVLLQSKVGGGVTESGDWRANLSREH